MERDSWHCTGDKNQDHPQEKEMQKKVIRLSEEALQITMKRREEKAKEKRRDKKAFLSEQYKEIEENNRMRKIGDLFKKIRDTNGTFHAKLATKKDRNVMDLREADDIKNRWQEIHRTIKKKILMTRVTTMEPSLT